MQNTTERQAHTHKSPNRHYLLLLLPTFFLTPSTSWRHLRFEMRFSRAFLVWFVLFYFGLVCFGLLWFVWLVFLALVALALALSGAF